MWSYILFSTAVLNFIFICANGYRCICNNGPAYQIHESRDPNAFVMAVAYPYDCFKYLGTEGSYWKTNVNGKNGYFWIRGYNEPHITECSNPIRDIGSSGDCLLVTYNSYFYSHPVPKTSYHLRTLPPCRNKGDCAQILDGNPSQHSAHPWYHVRYNGVNGYVRADNEYVMRWHCGFPPPHNHGVTSAGRSLVNSGSSGNGGSSGNSGGNNNTPLVKIVYVTQPPPKTTQKPAVTPSPTTPLPYINPSMFPVCSHSKVAFSVGNPSLQHQSAAACPDNTHTSKEAFVLNACSAPSMSSWHRGPKVTDYCLQIPKYTPIATFVHFGLYNPADDRSGIGVFISCEGNGFMMILQLCGMNPTTVHLNKGDSDYVSNADNYYVIQWNKP